MSGLNEFDPVTDLPPDFMMIMYGMRRTGKTTALLTILESMKERFEKHKVFVFSGTGRDHPEQWRNFPLNVVKTDIANIDRMIGEVLANQRDALVEEVKRQIAAMKGGAGGRPKELMSKEQIEAQETPDPSKPGKGKKRKRKKQDNNQVIPVEEDKGQDNDLKRWPGELNHLLEGNKQVTDADIAVFRRAKLVDEATMPHILVILDDVVNEGAIRNSPNLNSLAVYGRHLFITAIMLSQCVCGSMSVPPGIRINSDFVLVVGNPRSKRERELLQEQYLTISNERANANEGLQILADTARVEFRILAINTSSSSVTQFNEYLFKYGPVPAPPDNVSDDFRMGTESQWEDDTKLNREPKFTNKDFLKDPPKGPDLQAIDSGRFGVGHRSGIPGDEHVSKGIERFVSRHAEFLAPYF